MVRVFIYFLFLGVFVGCGSKVVLAKKPTQVNSYQIEATEHCDVERD
jgi:prepilin signal peptidase PulO-like enzyme (type II secretory pathway)